MMIAPNTSLVHTYIFFYEKFKILILKELFFKIRTIGTEKNIQVQVDVNCPNGEMDYLSQVIIKPALKAENYTKGICGYWYDTDIVNENSRMELNRADNTDDSINNIALRNRYFYIFLSVIFIF